MGPANSDELRFLCGCYTTELGHVSGQGESVGVYALDDDSGAIRRIGASPPVANSSHLCLGPAGKFLYCISEVSEYQGNRDGYLTVFALDDNGAHLTAVQTISSRGPGPAYVSLDQSGRFLLLANYVAGNVVVYPIEENGLLAAPTANVMHAGSSVNPDRQEGPHPHSIVASPDNRFVFVADLGLDRIVAYQFDASSGALEPRPELDAATPPGSGPRHMVFAPSGKRAYLVLELSSEIATYKYDNGQLHESGRVRTTPADFKGVNYSAEIRVSPGGEHVYVSNRGRDSLAVMAVDARTGELVPVQTISTRGKTPRNFGISPNGRWIVAANQDSHSLIAFRRDARTGELRTPGEVIETPSPALIYFLDSAE